MNPEDVILDWKYDNCVYVVSGGRLICLSNATGNNNIQEDTTIKPKFNCGDIVKHLDLHQLVVTSFKYEINEYGKFYIYRLNNLVEEGGVSTEIETVEHLIRQ